MFCMEMTEFDNPKTPLVLDLKDKMRYMGNKHPASSEIQNGGAGSNTKSPESNSNGEYKMTLGQRLNLRKKLIQRRRWIVDVVFLLAMIGIIIMMIETELFIVHGIEKTSVVSLTLKSLILASTILLLVMIFVNYYVGAQIRALDAGVKHWTSVMSTWNWVALMAELTVCCLHPFPGNFNSIYVSPEGKVHEVSIDAVLSILMTCRLYLVGKFAVAHSRLLTDTSTNSIGALSKVKINTMFVFKAAMTNYPMQLLVLVMATTFLVNSWAMRACERYYEPGNRNINYLETMWLVAITFLTVGYGDKTPRSYCGRYISICTGAMGVVTTALLVVIISKKLQQSRKEVYVFNFVSRMQIEYRKKTAASNAIKAIIRIWILKRYGNEFKSEIRKYDDKLKQALKEMKVCKEDMDHIGDDAVSIVDVAHSVNKISDVVDKNTSGQGKIENNLFSMELRLNTVERKLNEIHDLLTSGRK